MPDRVAVCDTVLCVLNGSLYKRSKGSRQMWTPFGKWIDDSTLNWEATLSFLTGNARANPLREEFETD